MIPQAATVGIRLARRLRPVLQIAAAKASDPVAFFGGMLAAIVGQVAGMIGKASTAELLRTVLAQLDQAAEPGRIALPAGVQVDDADPDATLPGESSSASAARFADSPEWYAVRDSESYSSVRYRAVLHPTMGEQEVWIAHNLAHHDAEQIARDHNKSLPSAIEV